VRKTLGALAVVALLLGVTISSELRLRSMAWVDPLGRELLYLPSVDMLKLLSLGNEGLMADLVFLWSIQYYSEFQPQDKFLYLETVYDMITDLDPLYFDAYRVGALIMSIERHGGPAERNAKVARIYDKGLGHMPNNWELAEVAAWDAFLQLRDRDMALRYARIGASIPGCPHRMRRVYGRWSEEAVTWTLEDSIAYWQEALDEAVRWPDIVLSKNHLYDAYAELHAGQLNPLLAAHRDRFGRCADNWQPLIDAGWISKTPLDYVGNPYGIDVAECVVQPHKKIRWERD
jgi:hypothetical protein